MLGKEILGVDALPGQSNTGPLDALQKRVLDKVCQSSGMLLCLTVLTADTIASSSGASTHFQLARATLAGSGHGVDVGVAESRSAINTTGSCQTSSGSSSAATVNVMGGPVATAGQSSESPSACAGQAASQQACSRVLGQAAANTLPFAGQDVLKVLFLGLLLVAGGLALAVRTRQMS